MAKSPSTPQQGGTSTQPQQQQGEVPPSTPQQGTKPIFRDWASI